MNAKKKLVVATALLSLSMTQTGCLVGLVAWPMWIVGSVVGVTGALVASTPGSHYNQEVAEARAWGVGMMVLGGALDTQNPGRADALNEISMNEENAKNANVHVADIKSYNRALDQVRKVGAELAGDIRGQVLRHDVSYANAEQLSHDSQIDHLAAKYGFDNGAALFNSFNKKALPAQTVAKFARNMDLTEGQAKLLLYYGFGVKAE